MERDPFDCHQFHELCMDYRAAQPWHPFTPQHAFERLQEYCRAASAPAPTAPLEWPKLDPISSTTAADRLGMEPFELTERS
jgi:hypothetical protein